MKNITIKVQEEVARWARVWAAQHNTSVSRMLGEKLEEMMQEDRRYKAARQRFMAKESRQLRDDPEQSYPSRADAHER